MKRLLHWAKVACFITPLWVSFIASATSAEQPAKLEVYNELKSWLVEQHVIDSVSVVPPYLNNLIYANSPYLISHALQPIDWQEWRPAFETGSNDSKLLFVSIGYSTCHWCHVMAQESFRSIEVAAVLNESYVSVKVDREQWPLVDTRFKSALEAMKGEAGWPINAILTPNGKLIWIDSYLDKQSFTKVLIGLAKRWQTKPSAVQGLAKRVEQKLLLDKPPVSSSKSVQLSSSQWREVLPSIHSDIASGLAKDQQAGGPRFFRAYWLLGLLEQYLRQRDLAILHQVQNHVDAVIVSPTYDAIEGGFHRYAVDGDWQVPHFEKMLYTQANMLRVLAKLYAITKQARYKIAILQTVEWTERWLNQQAGMGSAVSALSEGLEGKYYQLAATERSRINYSADWPQSVTVKALRQARAQRVKPAVDEKVILSWNSAYVVALLEAYQATQLQSLLDKAFVVSDKLWRHFVDEDQIYRSSFAGRAAIKAEAEDLAWFAQSQLMLSFYSPFMIEEQDTSSAKTKKDSPYYRGQFLLDRLVASIETPAELDRVINLNRDGEIPSARSVAFSALTLGYNLSQQRQYKQYAKAVSALSLNWQRQLVNEYAFVVQQANVFDAVRIGQASFARGNGRVIASEKSNSVELNFEMAAGWHINAHQIDNRRLIATEVSIESADEILTYPNSIEKKLGFDNQVLQLYEGNFTIVAMIPEGQNFTGEVNLTLQACSDKLCLLPENIKIYL
ncbi:DUF255 domain-containing protein [Shewanella waksmanii]|uniref:DUF255 domain-containing protein n=1 Tax=Shewanella waksmanii TaxID=213783 RepID=UPI00048A6E04|nr:DUF255 domain-containing protein [Shewanella waksmanii]